jgi:hypothetical protein
MSISLQCEILIGQNKPEGPFVARVKLTPEVRYRLNQGHRLARRPLIPRGRHWEAIASQWNADDCKQRVDDWLKANLPDSVATVKFF